MTSSGPLGFRAPCSFLSPPPGVTASWHLLGIPAQCQARRYWCWAAVAVSVEGLYRPSVPTLSQCQLASAIASERLPIDCCADDACDEARLLSGPLKRLGHYGQLRMTPLAFDELARLIDSGIAVVATIEWTDATSHVVLVEGYDAATRRIAVDDPYRGPMNVTYQDLLSRYDGRGVWVQTYVTAP